MKKNGNLLAAGLTLGLVVVFLSGCAGTTPVTQPTAQTAQKQSEGTKQFVKEAKPETPPLEGKVLETIATGGYSYILLEKDGKKGWVAVPGTKVTVGQDIKVRPGLEMGLFSSKTLKRSFDNIIFSPGLVTGAPNQPVQVKPTAEAAMNLPPGHKAVDKKTQLQGEKKQSAPEAKAQPKKKDHMGIMAQPGNEMTALSGKVIETRDAGGYTYINLEKDGKQSWAAVPTMKVTVGEEMKLQPGAVMKNFTSKSMNRTFESVIFSGGVIPAN